MSRWEPTNEAIARQRQSDGCGKLLFISGSLLVIGLVAAFIISWAIQPRCFACNHPRHPQQMCGSYVYGMTTCICEKDGAKLKAER